jgi:hypothetical protein
MSWRTSNPRSRAKGSFRDFRVFFRVVRRLRGIAVPSAARALSPLLALGPSPGDCFHGGAAEEVDAALGHGSNGQGIPTHHRANPSWGDAKNAGSVGGTQELLDTHGLSPFQGRSEVEKAFLKYASLFEPQNQLKRLKIRISHRTLRS